MAGALALTAGLTAHAAWADGAADGFRAIEARVGGRLGFFAQQGHGVVQWRGRERFLMCSTFKALAVAAVLARVDAGREWLDRQVAYDRRDLLPYAPVTAAHVAQGEMTLAALCAAAIEVSDNTAANLILASLSGPQGVTRFVRALGDETTRLDHTEPALNRPGPPGDFSDTTTPASMVGLWRKLLLENTLSPVSRERLTSWLVACQTGAGRLKAALPPGWRIAHKTGSGRTTIGDVALLTPPAGRPVLIATYLDIPAAPENNHDEALAQAGRLALTQLASHAG